MPYNAMQSSINEEGQVSKEQVQLSEAARQNLDRNTELWRAESQYVKLEDGEYRVLQFNPERIKQVEGQYGARIQYMVIDPNYPDREKKFEAGKQTSRDIDTQLRQGNRVLKIRRLGVGTDTRYSVQPA